MNKLLVFLSSILIDLGILMFDSVRNLSIPVCIGHVKVCSMNEMCIWSLKYDECWWGFGLYHKKSVKYSGQTG